MTAQEKTLNYRMGEREPWSVPAMAGFCGAMILLVEVFVGPAIMEGMFGFNSWTVAIWQVVFGCLGFVAAATAGIGLYDVTAYRERRGIVMALLGIVFSLYAIGFAMVGCLTSL